MIHITFGNLKESKNLSLGMIILPAHLSPHITQIGHFKQSSYVRYCPNLIPVSFTSSHEYRS